jgi:hypothetical protein
MRLLKSLLLAALTFAAAALAIDRGAFADDDPPKTKQQLRKELKQQFNKADFFRKAGGPFQARPQPPSAEPAPRPKPNPRPATEVARLIDEHIDRKLAEVKVSPAAVCSDDEFLRRAYLDLTGVIPTADAARTFLDSTDPRKRDKLIDELLASENYGKRHADLWMPKLFPRDSANRFVLREPLVKWLAEQFNANTPWDRFVYELLTASGTVEENPAVTYYLANRSVDKLTDTVTQHFLGVQLQCAQCHNHPFNAWKQDEYWGMAAFFSKVQPQVARNPAQTMMDNSQLSVRELPTRTRLRDFFPESTRNVPPKFLGGPQPRLSPAEPYRPALARWLTAPDNPYFARAMVNRTWGQLFGRGFVNPIDDLDDDDYASHPDLFAALTQEFVASGFDLKHLIRGICLSTTYQRTSKAAGLEEVDPALFARMAVKVMTPEQLYDSLARFAGPAAGRGLPGRPIPALPNRPGGGPREQFVQFFLAGAEQANTTEYEAGIPQALRLMNSRLAAGNPAAVRGIVPPGTRPERAFEAIYLAALSRRPTADEVKRLTAHVARVGNPNEAYADILWAVLNSSEFTLVR